jgi:aldehyde dehydrogenase (NAD+)
MSVAEILDTMDYGPAPESTTEAVRWLDDHDRAFGVFINGKWSKHKSDRSFQSKNPATGDVLANITQCDSRDINRAVKVAKSAQISWAATSGHERAKYLYALARLLQKHARLFAVLETLDNGKPIRESRDIDIALVIRHFYHHAGWAQLQGSEFPDHVPVGVVGQIIPWNFPLLMLAWKVAPAIAAGNTVVLKPAEFTSLTALRFAELCLEAGLPPGVVNIVTGDGRVGELIVDHPDIDKIAFTGSTEVGRRIRHRTAGRGKKLSLELGGKSPFIVFDDADLDGAIEGLVDAIWLNQGEVCCAGSRLLVHESIEKPFLKKLKTRMATLRVGDPLDKCIDVGAIVDESQVKQIKARVNAGVAEGATLFQAKSSIPAKGCFFPPTLLSDVHPSMSVVQDEIFGPVLVSMTFRTPDEAVALANNTRYGLAASIWSENINLALDMAPAIKAGVVWINCTNQFDAAVGFGGYRESGVGREGGIEGMYEYLVPAHEKSPDKPARIKPVKITPSMVDNGFAVDRTAKFYIGGKQARPDSGYSLNVSAPDGTAIDLVGDGSRKDIRNAVEAAVKAAGWAKSSSHLRAQILYFIAENLSARSAGFADRIRQMTGASKQLAIREVETSISRLFSYGAWADKFEGNVHSPPMRGVALAMKEPVGIIGIGCPESTPLLGFVSLVAPAIAMGNRTVVIPSFSHPLSATDFYQVLDTSDVPGGVVNIITGDKSSLLKTLSEHEMVDGVWCFGDACEGEVVERGSAQSIKRTWVRDGNKRDFFDTKQGEGREFLHQATEVKNIWIPYGE